MFSKPLNRQAMFRTDGTFTDVPTKLTENPNLEKQGDLFQYGSDTYSYLQLIRSMTPNHKEPISIRDIYRENELVAHTTISSSSKLSVCHSQSFSISWRVLR
jgi:hypothetical protein